MDEDVFLVWEVMLWTGRMEKQSGGSLSGTFPPQADVGPPDRSYRERHEETSAPDWVGRDEEWGKEGWRDVGRDEDEVSMDREVNGWGEGRVGREQDDLYLQLHVNM